MGHMGTGGKKEASGHCKGPRAGVGTRRTVSGHHFAFAMLPSLPDTSVAPINLRIEQQYNTDKEASH